MRSINLDDMLDNDRGKQALARVVEVPFVVLHDLKAENQIVGKAMSRVIIPFSALLVLSTCHCDPLTHNLFNDNSHLYVDDVRLPGSSFDCTALHLVDAHLVTTREVRLFESARFFRDVTSSHFNSDDSTFSLSHCKEAVHVVDIPSEMSKVFDLFVGPLAPIIIKSFTAFHHVLSERGLCQTHSLASWLDFLDSSLSTTRRNILMFLDIFAYSIVDIKLANSGLDKCVLSERRSVSFHTTVEHYDVRNSLRCSVQSRSCDCSVTSGRRHDVLLLGIEDVTEFSLVEKLQNVHVDTVVFVFRPTSLGKYIIYGYNRHTRRSLTMP
eukprot:GHVR01159930.1.p1 GENE.GHVR01159930.1~~GHVR01159930.1.p1  ORF type:complete len:325 (-),score=-22.82 GHVR01159930.1:323-1297(-)